MKDHSFHEQGGRQHARQVSGAGLDLERAHYLQKLLADYATGGQADDRHYRALRRYFLDCENTRVLVPKWLRRYKSLAAFWHFISLRFASFSDRKAFIALEFKPLLDFFEAQPNLSQEPTPVKPRTSERLQTTWQKALSEVELNPEGAITLAIINLETTCKNILERLGSSFDTSNLDLYGLYQETVKAMALFNAANELNYRALLSTLSEIVSNLDLCNEELSQGSRAEIPAREAKLLVNLAGAIANFLLESQKTRETIN